jgi:hypothetical protein
MDLEYHAIHLHLPGLPAYYVVGVGLLGWSEGPEEDLSCAALCG